MQALEVLKIALILPRFQAALSRPAPNEFGGLALGDWYALRGNDQLALATIAPAG